LTVIHPWLIFNPSSSIEHPVSIHMPIVLLAYYCVLILLASLAGGMIPVWFRLTHRGMQFAVSFVAGVMLGVGVLHMLPHAIAEAAAVSSKDGNPLAYTMLSLLAGVLVMFFMERFLCFHHHDVPDDGRLHDAADVGACDHDHGAHDISWGGAALGLAFHSVLNGVALAAAVAHGGEGAELAGFGTFLVVFLHKPFDAMTIGTLMARGRSRMSWRLVVNALFSLAIPLGVLLFYVGFQEGSSTTAYALAFSAGTFLCISLSDLLPELQFHHHDRVKLSLALVAGLAVAYGAALFESQGHTHSQPSASAQ
jgi:zinc and cadmium transporter